MYTLPTTILHSLKTRLVCIVLLSLVFSFNYLQAQIPTTKAQVYKPNINRILFVVDGSGSMKQKWGEKTKFETAKELLAKIIDSVERKNPNVEFAVRVFGAQFPREQKNCKDSKLFIPFAKNNGPKIAAALKGVTPQGMSPVAFSVLAGAKDFPMDEKSLNSLILITDGEENCEGDPCAASKELAEKKISLKPFIVGLNVDSSQYTKFNCVGTFFDTKDEASFYNTVGVIIRQTLNTTTVQVNLLDLAGNPTVTNIPFTLYDHLTGKIEYNFVHTLDEKGNADTLYLDPVGLYDLELHTFPSIRKNGIELVPGKHNIIALDVPAGDLNVECIAASIATNDAQVLVRPKKEPKNILNVQDMNGTVKYLSEKYQLEILTLPETFIDTSILAFTETKASVANFGSLILTAPDNMLAGIYSIDKAGMLHLAKQFIATTKSETHKLQPGSYYIVYRPKNSYDSETTKSQQFVLEEGKMVVLTL